MLLPETNRGHIFWSVHSHLRAASLELLLQGHRLVFRADGARGRHNGPFLTPAMASFKEVMQSRDVFQPDIPVGALPRTRGGEKTSFLSSQCCPLVIAGGLVGVHLFCSGDPHLHLTSLDHTRLSNLGSHLGPLCGLGPSFLTEKTHGVLTSSLQVWTQPTLGGFFLGFASTQRASTSLALSIYRTGVH